MPAPPRRFPPPSTVEEDASIERWLCAGQLSRSSFRLSAWLRVRRKLSRARVITFVRSAPSRTASGHARSSAPGQSELPQAAAPLDISPPSAAAPLPPEDRACITAAANKLPPVSANGIKGSRALPQQSAGLRQGVYRVTVEIDVAVAGQNSTYVFNCVRDGQLTVIQPLGMR